MTQLPVSNYQASLALTEDIIVGGIFPSRDPGTASGLYLGEICTYAFNFQPDGADFTDGQTVSIASNTALFSLLGTNYGGNGTTNYLLPDLQGATMIGAGNSASLGSLVVGQGAGSASVTLTPSELPASLGGQSQSISNYQPGTAVTYMICVSGVTPTLGIGAASLDLVGDVDAFAGNFSPAGFMACDGQMLSIANYQLLYEIIGTTYGGDGITTFALPNLQGRAIVGASAADPVGSVIGQPTVSLSNNQAPNLTGAAVQSFTNTEPSVAMEYLIATTGIFPSNNGGGGSVGVMTNPYIGQIQAFAGTFIPMGWALADGQLLNISSNTALFSVLGTTYGGDGKTTFALPNLNGAAVVGAGGGLTIGSAIGSADTTLSGSEIGGGLSINLATAGVNSVSLYNTSGDWDSVTGSNGTAYLSSAQTTLTGGGDTANFTGGSGNAASLINTGGNWDWVYGSNGDVYLNSAQVSVQGGGDLIDFASGTGDAASLYNTGGSWDWVYGSGGSIYLNSAQTSVAGGGNAIAFISGANDAISLYSTGGNWGWVYGSNGTVYLNDAQTSLSGGGDKIILDGNAADAVSLYSSGGNWDSVTGSNGTIYMNGSQASVSGNSDTFDMAGANSVSAYGTSDAFIFGPAIGVDYINNFGSTDKMQFSKSDFANFAALSAPSHMAQSGANTVISLDASELDHTDQCAGIEPDVGAVQICLSLAVRRILRLTNPM